MLEESRDGLIKVVDVKKFQDFMKAFKSPREAFPHLAEVAISDDTIDDFEHFFFRQKFNGESYIPDLKPSCTCRQILNPDSEVALCPNPMCGQYMHLSCLRDIADRKCYECKTEFPIKDLYHIKRTHNQLEHSSTLEEVVEPVNKRRRIEDEPSEKRPYPSIKSEELARKLEELVNHQKAKHTQAMADQPKANQVRKNAKENFSHCLLFGVYEAKDSQNANEI